MTLPSTRKLYWADPLRRGFTARILQTQQGDQPSVVLNRTLFYPSGGGQPHDTGRLGSVRVLGVEQKEGLIHHRVERVPDETTELTGEIDWPRRWDHMQQHSGQHLLSAAFLDLIARPTIGFHLSPDSVTIDVPGAAPATDDLIRVADFTQAIIAENRPIHNTILPPDEAAALPLRKPPTVAGPVRVVEIENIDWSACGGTHVPATAAIGSIIITRLERRGPDTRIHFLCGERAIADHRQRLSITQSLGERLTTSLADLPGAVTRLQDELDRSQKALRQAETGLSAATAAQLLAAAPSIGGVRLIRHELDGDDPDALRRLLSALIECENCVAAVGWSSQKQRWAAGRSADVSLDLRALLPAIRALPGTGGGGGPDLIQGGAPDVDTLRQVLDALHSALTQSVKGRQGNKETSQFG